MNLAFHIVVYTLIALFFPTLLWLFATLVRHLSVREILATALAIWQRVPLWWRAALLPFWLGLWVVGVVLTATTGHYGPGVDWRLGLRQGAIQLPWWLTLIVVSPAVLSSYRDKR